MEGLSTSFLNRTVRLYKGEKGQPWVLEIRWAPEVECPVKESGAMKACMKGTIEKSRTG